MQTYNIERLTASLLTEIARDKGDVRPRPRAVRQAKPFNGIKIPLATQRDLILEKDKLYAQSVRQLAAQKAQGIVNGNAKGIHQWQMTAALRRARVPYKLAKRMMLA